MSPLFCIIIPLMIEVLWASFWLPRAWQNLRSPENGDGVTHIEDLGPYLLFGEMLIGSVFALYHWPITLLALIWSRKRIPFRLIVVGMITTMAIYSGILLLLAKPFVC